MDTFNANSKLNTFFNVLSTNKDRKGSEFVSTMEGQYHMSHTHTLVHTHTHTKSAKKYPIYGVQWHPEKNGFEWTTHETIPHSEHAVMVMQMAANFFVQEGQLLS